MHLPRIAVTMGDPAGVGPEICLRLLQDPEVLRQCHPILFGDASVLQRVAAECRLPIPKNFMRPDEWSATCQRIAHPCVLDLGQIEGGDVKPGQVSAEAGAACYAYITQAIRAALAGEVAAVTTAPINKESLHAAQVPFPGHTEIFASLTKARRTCMMLTSNEITCSLVTAHVGLRDVPGLLSVPRIVDTIELTVDILRRFGRQQPRLVACGLNPHAGESGLFGAREEERFIIPALEAVRAEGMAIEGPLPPDTAFLPARRRETDAFICMYHDQGLIPLKMLAFDTAVNVTLGLPIIRTSVDHGTAYDIAWRGQARSTSLCEAAKLAARLAGARDDV